MGKKKIRYSIRKQLMLIFTASYTVISLTVGIICLLTMSAITISDKKKMAEEMIEVISSYIDPKTVLEYAQTGVLTPEIEIPLKQSAKILEKFVDFKSMEICIYNNDGTIQELYEMCPNANSDYLKTINEKIKKDPVNKRNVISQQYKGVDDKGIYYIYSRPITYIRGEYAYSINTKLEIKTDVFNNINTALELVIFMAALTFLVHAMNARVINRIIVYPLKEITGCTKNFRYNSEQDCQLNLQALQNVRMTTENEIKELYYSLIESIRQTTNTFVQRDIAKAEARNASFLAYKDPLTHVGNKGDYERKLKQLQDIENYAIVVADINGLKYINDTYGHQVGDEYIKGCCQLLCDVFKNSPVCRTGGDEFTVFLTHDSYILRDSYMEDIKARLEIISKNKDLPYWERYSFSIGIAEKTEAESAEKVCILADTRMYKDKQENKTKFVGHKINSFNIDVENEKDIKDRTETSFTQAEQSKSEKDDVSQNNALQG